jgi:hypothetical protein
MSTSTIVIPGYDPGQNCEENAICNGGVGNGGYIDCNWPYIKKTKTYYIVTEYPPTAGTPGQPYLPPSESQVSINMNEGWDNSCSETIDQLSLGYLFKCTISHDNRALFLGLDVPGSSLQPLNYYEHGLMITQAGVYEWESGVQGRMLASSYKYTDVIKINRFPDGRIVYAINSGGVEYSLTSTVPLDESKEIEVFAVLYRADDKILSADFDTVTVPVDPTVELDQESEAFLSVGDSATFEQEGLVEMQPFFEAHFEQIAVATCRMNYREFMTISGTLGAVRALVTDAEDGEFDGISSTFNGILVKANDNYEPPKIEGITGILAPVAGTSLMIDIDSGEINADIAGVEATVFDQENIMWCSGTFHPVKAESWEGPEGYLVLDEDISLRIDPEQLRELVLALIGTLQLEDTSELHFDRIFSVLESIGLADSAGMLADRILAVRETIGLIDNFAFDIDDLPDFTSGAAWVMNLDIGATTIYKHYDFNSFFHLDGVAYGVANNGIYRLQDTDVYPEAYIDFGNRKFGTSRLKRIPYWYAAVASNGKLVLRLEVEGNTWYYEMKDTQSGFVDNHKIKVGKGVKGIFWNPILVAPEGVSIEELESLHFETVVLKRNM